MAREQNKAPVVVDTRGSFAKAQSSHQHTQAPPSPSRNPNKMSTAPAALGSHAAVKPAESADGLYSSPDEALKNLLNLIHKTAIPRGSLIEAVFEDLGNQLDKIMDIEQFRNAFYGPHHSAALTDEYEVKLATTLAKSVGKDPDSYLTELRKRNQLPLLPLTLQFEQAIHKLGDTLDEEVINKHRIKFAHCLNQAPAHLRHHIEQTIIDELLAETQMTTAEVAKFKETIAATVLDQCIYTALNYLMCNDGFKELAAHLETFKNPLDPRCRAIMKALDTPLISELLAEFMAQKDGVKAFSSQNIKLQPHDYQLTGLKPSRRSNIKILLGNYHTSQIDTLYGYTISCMRVAFNDVGEDSNPELLRVYLKNARAKYRDLNDEQKKQVAAPDIISCKREDLPKNWQDTIAKLTQDKTVLTRIHISALLAMKACQPDLLKALSYGDLHACNIKITMLQKQLRHKFFNFTPEHPDQYAEQLQKYYRILNEQLLVATQARDTNPGPGHLFYAYVLSNFSRFYTHLTRKPIPPTTLTILSNASDQNSKRIVTYLKGDRATRRRTLADYALSASTNAEQAVNHEKATGSIFGNADMYRSLIFTEETPTPRDIQREYTASANVYRNRI